jgi:Flp pilus assembly protein TadD
LNLDHGITVSKTLVDPPTTIIALAALSGLTLLGVLSARRSRFLSFSIIWLLGNLAGESSLFGLEMVFEHRMYLPSILVIAVVVLLIRGAIRNVAAFSAVVACAGILCAVWTYERNHVWADEFSLWSDAADKSPENYRPFYNMGIILSEKGLTAQAITAFEKSIALNPEYAEAYNNLGYEYLNEGNDEKAIQQFRKAMTLSPVLEEPYINMAKYYEREDMVSKAFDSIQNGLEKMPESFPLLTHLGTLFMRAGDIQNASVQFAKALKIRPESPEALNNLGVVLIQIGRKDDAIRLFREAIRNDPNHRGAIHNLSTANGMQ